MVDLSYISQRRLELGITLQAAAEALGFKNASNYLKYESGEYKFRAEMMPALANILECDVQKFFKD